MKLERIENETVLDGEGTMLVSKNDFGLSLKGFQEEQPVTITNQYIVGKHAGKRKQLTTTAKWIYSEEIKTTKKAAVHVLGGLIGASVGVALSLLSKKI